MCLSPTIFSNGTIVPCRLCWQCRRDRINDWVGRCIAESKDSVAAHAVTLTYGRDKSLDSISYGESEHERAAILTYSDVQKYFKKLRFNGFPCRYFAVGEYGSDKGRAHWHIIIFWKDRVPEHVCDKRFNEAHWDWGWSEWSRLSYGSVRYVMKYISKDIGVAERQGHLSMSKKPPLGAGYFDDMARRYAEASLVPQTFEYTFPEAVSLSGKRVKFRLQGRSRELFLDAFVRHWRALHGEKYWPWSKILDEHLDPYSWKVDRTGKDWKYGTFRRKRT